MSQTSFVEIQITLLLPGSFLCIFHWIIKMLFLFDKIYWFLMSKTAKDFAVIRRNAIPRSQKVGSDH